MARPSGSGNRLQRFHYRAIELRFAGKSFEDIARELTVQHSRDFKTDTVRHWFAKGGMLFTEYLEHARSENDARRQLVMEELKKLHNKIPALFQDLLALKPDGMTPGQQIYWASTMNMILKNFCAMLGIKVDDESGAGGRDMLEEFFNRLDNDEKKQNGESNQPPV